MSRPATAAATTATTMAAGPYLGAAGRGRAGVRPLLLGEAAQLPRRLHGVEEVRRPLVGEARVVDVVLLEPGLAAARRADGTAELLRDDAVDRQRPDVGAAVVVVDHEGVQQ